MAPTDRGVQVTEHGATAALVQWPDQRPVPGIRMYQIQYNSSADDILVYRCGGLAVGEWGGGIVSPPRSIP